MAMVFRLLCTLLVFVGILVHCTQVDEKAETEYPENTFRRVTSASGIALRAGPDEKSPILVTVPALTHVRLLKTRDKKVRIRGRSGLRAFVDWSPMSKLKQELKLAKDDYQGWTYTWNLAPVDIKIGPNLFRDFKSGCLLGGCFTCGTKVFNPDGTFVNSFDCHEKPESGRWVAQDGMILACTGSCRPSAKPEYRFVVRENKIVMECAQKPCEEGHINPAVSERIVHWEPHDFQ